MKLTARPVPGSAGMVELLADGKPVEGIRCRAGSARVSGSMIEFTATVQVPPYRAPAAKRKAASAATEESVEDNN